VSFVDQDEFWQSEKPAKSGEVSTWLWLALVLAVAAHLMFDRLPWFKAPARVPGVQVERSR
jgi:hypothetical protein